MMKLTQKNLFSLLTLGENKRDAERQRGVCRLTVCQTTRSAHPGRGVGFLTEYSYLKPRSLLCGCERDRRVGPDRDSAATWPLNRFDVLCRLNECVTVCFVGR